MFWMLHYEQKSIHAVLETHLATKISNVYLYMCTNGLVSYAANFELKKMI